MSYLDSKRFTVDEMLDRPPHLGNHLGFVSPHPSLLSMDAHAMVDPRGIDGQGPTPQGGSLVSLIESQYVASRHDTQIRSREKVVTHGS